jgi:hypothetical protein
LPEGVTHTVIVVTLLFLAVLCVIALFAIRPEEPPRTPHQRVQDDRPARHTGTELMPAVVRPAVPDTQKAPSRRAGEGLR